MDQPSTECRNCHAPISSSIKFCQNCGQKTDAYKLGVLDLFYNFWNSLTNLDGSVFNTLKYLWKPWELTRYYVEGKRKYFLNPIRVLLIVMAFYFGMIVSAVDFDQVEISNKMQENYYLSKMHSNYIGLVDSIPQECKGVVEHIDTTLFADTLLMDRDSSINFVFNGFRYCIATNDIMELSLDSIYKKYHYTTFKQKLISKQLIKASKDSSGAFKKILGNTIWGTFFTIFAISLVFKLLYIRQKKYYVEHLVLQMNIHSLVQSYFFLTQIQY